MIYFTLFNKKSESLTISVIGDFIRPENEAINNFLYPREGDERNTPSIRRHVRKINSIKDFSYSSRLPLYDLIATHGKTSERIDETKRSGGMKMGTDETSERAADIAVEAEG